jgi:hypothetical protein
MGPRPEEAPIGLSLKVISSFPDCEVYNMTRDCQMSRTHNVRSRVGPACVRGTALCYPHCFSRREPSSATRHLVLAHSGKEPFCHHITGDTGWIAVEFRGHLVALFQVEAGSLNFHRV